MNLSNDLLVLAEKPIAFDYRVPSRLEVEGLKAEAAVCVIAGGSNITLVNSYHVQGLKGTLPKMWARQSVATRVTQIAEKLGASFGLMIFDAYRSLATQRDLFAWMCDQVRSKNPSWTDEEINVEARRFASDPDKGRFAVPPHNSGGAIDLAIYDVSSSEMLIFGGDFDEASARSRTDFYEGSFDASIGLSESEWLAARRNRRVLFHLMTNAGFTNYHNEWWHYDLGDCLWAEIVASDWQYESMENGLIS